MKKGQEKMPRKKQSLGEFAHWDGQTLGAFEGHLLNLRTTPTSKGLINSMIKLEQMYQPLTKRPLTVDLFGRLASINEGRRALRGRAYLFQKDLVKSVNGQNGKTLVLTTRAHKIFYQSFPLAKLRQEKWDGFWTMVSYDFPETLRQERDHLRDKLKDLGFGSAQESLLITPLPLEEPIQELLEGEKVVDFAWVLRAERVLGLSNRTMAARAWNLEMIGSLYAQLLEVLPKIKKTGSKNLLTDWQEHFLAVFLDDPYLPQELLPEDWAGEDCQRESWKLGLPSLIRPFFR